MNLSNKKKSILTSVLFLIFGVFLFVQATGVKHMMKNDVGSGFFPKVIAIAIIAAAAIRLVMALREKESESKASGSDMAGGWITIALIGIYVLAFNPVGFIISTIVYLFAQILVLTPKEKRNWITISAISIIAPFALYALFTHVISSPLPKGIFGF